MKFNIFLLTVVLVSTCFAVKKEDCPRKKIIGFLPNEVKQKADQYDVRDYAQDSEVKKLLEIQCTLKNESEEVKKAWENEKSYLSDKVEAEVELFEKISIASDIIQRSPLFGRAIPSASLLIESTPQELVAFIDHYRIDKAKL